jgi:hypothetical protein
MALALEYMKARRRDYEASNMRSMRLVNSEIQAAE